MLYVQHLLMTPNGTHFIFYFQQQYSTSPLTIFHKHVEKRKFIEVPHHRNMIAYNLTKARLIYLPSHDPSAYIALFIACNSPLLSPFLSYAFLESSLVFIRIVVSFKNSVIVCSKYKMEEAMKYIRKIKGMRLLH